MDQLLDLLEAMATTLKESNDRQEMIDLARAIEVEELEVESITIIS